LRGIESIVGAYLAILAILGVMLGFYTWLNRAGSSINDQFNDSLERMYYLSYPPVMSLNYVNGAFILTIYPYFPMHIEEILVKDLDGNVYDYKYVNNTVIDKYSVELTLPRKNGLIIMVVARGGIVYYYTPKQDPNLLEAPEYIRDRAFVDEILVDYLVNGAGGNSESQASNARAVTVLDSIGYKVLAGRCPVGKVGDVLLRGPIATCPPNAGAADLYGCNVVVTTCNLYYISVTTYNANGSYWQVFNNGALYVSSSITNSACSSGYPYLQVLKLVRVKGDTPVNIKLDVNLNVTYMSPPDYSVAVVIYVLPPTFDFERPIAVAPIYLTSEGSIHWLERSLLAYGYLSKGASYVNTKEFRVELSKYGYEEVLMAIGVELVIHSTVGDIYVKIDVSEIN